MLAPRLAWFCGNSSDFARIKHIHDAGVSAVNRSQAIATSCSQMLFPAQQHLAPRLMY
jgi:hypothetical protein